MAGWEELVAAPPTPEEEKLIQACRDTRPELPGAYPAVRHEVPLDRAIRDLAADVLSL
jgi:hypothetical protein